VWVNASGRWGGPLPHDTFAFRGAGLQDTYIVPSRDLVIVRMGHFPGAGPFGTDRRRVLELLMRAIPERRSDSK
jgi:hypothetical protein